MSDVYRNADPYAAPQDLFVADAQLTERLSFLRRVYMHVFAATALMVGLEVMFFQTGLNLKMMSLMGNSWWISLIVFMAVSWFAERLAISGASSAAQYAGLGLYVVVQSVITAPVLTIATTVNPDLIGQAAFITILITGALTMYVVLSKSDFSFLRNALFLAGIGLTVLCFASAFFGFTLGIAFSVAVVVLMCGFILYETSLIMHHLPVTAHVAGAVMIFGSIAVLFREILFILLRLNDE